MEVFPKISNPGRVIHDLVRIKCSGDFKKLAMTEMWKISGEKCKQQSQSGQERAPVWAGASNALGVEPSKSFRVYISSKIYTGSWDMEIYKV